MAAWMRRTPAGSSMTRRCPRPKVRGNSTAGTGAGCHGRAPRAVRADLASSPDQPLRMGQGRPISTPAEPSEVRADPPCRGSSSAHGSAARCRALFLCPKIACSLTAHVPPATSPTAGGARQVAHHGLVSLLPPVTALPGADGAGGSMELIEELGIDPVPAGADPIWQPRWFHGDPQVWPPMVIVESEMLVYMNSDLPS